MIAYINGTISWKRSDALVLDHDGMGFLVFMPMRDLENAGPVGTVLTVYTYLQVSEDAMALYGFLTRDEEETFRMLLKVSGVGPKAAVGVLSVLSPEDLKFAILAKDVKTISKAPGIGKQTAGRIINDLSDRIDLTDTVEQSSSETNSSGSGGSARSDAVLALNALGYSSTEVLRALSRVPEDPTRTSEEWIREGLKALSGNL